MNHPKTRLRHLAAIQRGNAPQYKEIMRIARLEFLGFTDKDLIILATLAYYRLTCGSGAAFGLSAAFHKKCLSPMVNGPYHDLPVVSDEKKRAALREFYESTQNDTWFRWRACLEDLWGL